MNTLGRNRRMTIGFKLPHLADLLDHPLGLDIHAIFINCTQAFSYHDSSIQICTRSDAGLINDARCDKCQTGKCQQKHNLLGGGDKIGQKTNKWRVRSRNSNRWGIMALTGKSMVDSMLDLNGSNLFDPVHPTASQVWEISSFATKYFFLIDRRRWNGKCVAAVQPSFVNTDEELFAALMCALLCRKKKKERKKKRYGWRRVLASFFTFFALLWYSECETSWSARCSHQCSTKPSRSVLCPVTEPFRNDFL